MRSFIFYNCFSYFPACLKSLPAVIKKEVAGSLQTHTAIHAHILQCEKKIESPVCPTCADFSQANVPAKGSNQRLQSETF